MPTTITSMTMQGARSVVDIDTLLTPDIRQRARDESNRWIKRLRLVRYDGLSMRERFTFRGDSLWWFTELYLHKTRRLETALSTVFALDALIGAQTPATLMVDTSDDVVRDAAVACGRARAIPIDVTGHIDTSSRIERESFLIEFSARLARWRPASRPSPPRSKVAAFIHTAFWRPSSENHAPQQESYVGSVLGAIHARGAAQDLTFVGVGPHRNFRARRWWDPIVGDGGTRPRVIPVGQLAPRRAIRESYAIWTRRHDLAREIVQGDGIREAAIVEGCDLWPCLSRELSRAALLQWPWSARVMDEAGAALDALQPDVAVTYAEAGGWGRALVLEARRRGVPTAGIQHGFIYHHWLNYLHEPDEIAPISSPPAHPHADLGAPIPDRTLLFDSYAAQHLKDAGHFPETALAVTGSAKLDDLAAAVARHREHGVGTIRRELGVADDERLLVLAAKFSEIGRVLPDLFAAVNVLAGVRLVVKTHPAETPAPYLALASGHARIAIAPAEADLARLLAAADAIVTMNSTVAIDGLVLGVPALVIGAPSNLAPFVHMGVMLAADAPGLAETLERLLYDRAAYDALVERAAQFAARHDMRADGRAAERAADEVLALADERRSRLTSLKTLATDPGPNGPAGPTSR